MAKQEMSLAAERGSLAAERGSTDDGSWPLLKIAFAIHEDNLKYHPTRAHWNAALVSTGLGVFLAGARGGFAALTTPAGSRAITFIKVTYAVIPLYVIPFVLGSQWDCYAASWRHNDTAKRHSSGADVLG